MSATGPRSTIAPLAGPADGPAPERPAVSPSDVRLVRGHLADAEIAAIAVVVSAMSVTSRVEAEERSLAEGLTGGGGWSDALRTHPRSHALRAQASSTAWQFGDR